MQLHINLTKFSYAIGNSHESSATFGFYRTRDQIMRVVQDGFVHSFSHRGEHLVRFRGGKDDTIRVYTLEKRRKIVQQIPATKRSKARHEVIRHAHWVARVYDIPTSLLDLLNLKTVQHARHFTLIKR